MGRATRRSGTTFTVALIASVLTASCTPDDGAAPITSSAVSTSTVQPARESDDRLTIGLLVPIDDPIVGQPLVAAAETAVDRINDAGGVLGENVLLISAAEGSTEAAAREALTDLTARGVDAIIGPSSSTIALSTLDDIVSTGVVACSPTASALALDEFPDNGLFFRTVPSDSLQAVAIADVAERTGVRDVAVAYIDDAYGRPFARTVEDALVEGSRSIGNVSSFGFTRNDGGLGSVAASMASTDAPVSIVLASAQDGVAFLEALSQIDHSSITDIVVNDALRSPAAQSLIEALDDDLRQKIIGVAPQIQAADGNAPFDPPGVFAAQTFDCVNLIALAATVVQSDDPAVFRSQIPALTTGGAVCDAFGPCADLLASGLDINYNGPDGITELLQVGDPARARFDLFRFDDRGRAVVERSVVASSL